MSPARGPDGPHAPRLLAITDRRRSGGDPVPPARALLERGGAEVVVLLREKDAPARALHTWIAALLEIARRTGGGVLVADRVDVAACFGGEVGVQLPEAGLEVGDARRLLGPRARVGASVHDRAGVERAIAAGADLLTLAPVLATPSKPGTLDGPQPVLGLDGLRTLVGAARAASAARPEVAKQVALYALGGIDAGSAPAVLACGVDGIAAIRAAWESDALLEAVRGAGPDAYGEVRGDAPPEL